MLAPAAPVTLMMLRREIFVMDRPLFGRGREKIVMRFPREKIKMRFPTSML
jgi:hypothetical protein